MKGPTLKNKLLSISSNFLKSFNNPTDIPIKLLIIKIPVKLRYLQNSMSNFVNFYGYSLIQLHVICWNFKKI